MANVNNPSGLKPLYEKSGTAPRLNAYGSWKIATDYTTAIYKGDLVTVNATNQFNLEKGTPSGANFVGVFWGVKYKDAQGNIHFSQYWPGVSDGKTDIEALVYDSPGTMFLITCDTSATPADTNIGKTGDIASGTTGSTLTGVSNETLATSTIGSDANLRIVDRFRAPDNEAGAYAKYIVYINEHKYK